MTAPAFMSRADAAQWLDAIAWTAETATVTVAIPTIPGRERLLDRALVSIDAQTRRPDHVVIEADPDGTGAGPTRNRALERVTTDWVAWLDDDDELLSDHLDVCLQTAATTGADLIYPYFEMVDEPGVTPHDRDPLAVARGGQWVSPFGVPFGPEQEHHLRTAGNFIPVTTLVRTAALRAVGGFPTPGTTDWPDPAREDWGVLIRLLDAGYRFAHAPERTWRWHHHAGHTGGLPVTS